MQNGRLAPWLTLQMLSCRRFVRLWNVCLLVPTWKVEEKKHSWCILTVQIIFHSPHQVKMQMGWRSAWCLIGINSLISGSLWCLQRNMMNNSEVHVAVIAPTNRHTYACPPSRRIRTHTSSQSHKNMHIHKYKVTHMLTHSEYIFPKCALNVEY